MKDRLLSVDTSLLTATDKVRIDREAESEIVLGNVDEEFVPFIRRINAVPWIVTTQCCQGHYNYNGSKALSLGQISLRVLPDGLQRFLQAIKQYQATCACFEELGQTYFEVDRNADGSLYLRFGLCWTKPEETIERMERFCLALET